MHPQRQKRGKTHSSRVLNEYHDDSSSLYWNGWAQHTVQNHIARELNTNKAKNVIFFLGDGMSVPTLTAARTYLGQKRGQTGEEAHLSFEEFPHIGLSKVKKKKKKEFRMSADDVRISN